MTSRRLIRKGKEPSVRALYLSVAHKVGPPRVFSCLSPPNVFFYKLKRYFTFDIIPQEAEARKVFLSVFVFVPLPCVSSVHVFL